MAAWQGTYCSRSDRRSCRQRLSAERGGDQKLGLRRGQRPYAFVFEVFDH
jgi:hypothetical protein